MIVKPQDLEPTLAQAVGASDLIVFDGECVLCSGFFQFMLKRGQDFQFATAQSALGQVLYAGLGLPCDEFQNNLVIVDGEIHGHLDAFTAAMRHIGWPW